MKLHMSSSYGIHDVYQQDIFSIAFSQRFFIVEETKKRNQEILLVTFKSENHFVIHIL